MSTFISSALRVIQRLLRETALNSARTLSCIFLSSLNKVDVTSEKHSLTTSTSEKGFLCLHNVHATFSDATYAFFCTVCALLKIVCCLVSSLFRKSTRFCRSVVFTGYFVLYSACLDS